MLKDLNLRLLKNIRSYIYTIAFFIIALTWVLYAKENSMTIDMANAFGYLAFSFLSLMLAMSPVRTIWPGYALNPSLYLARKALGVSAFVFALLHYTANVIVTFESDLSLPLFFAFNGVFGLLFGLSALMIMFVLFATSLDFIIKKLGKRWFTIHKLVYLTYPLILLHTYSLGRDFTNGLNIYSGSFLVIAVITILLETVRIYLHVIPGKPRIA